MERIAKLLFAVTALSIFCYLIIFSSMSITGNGGEYWGFDGRIEPHRAASRSFSSGNYHLLAVDMEKSLGGRVRIMPTQITCSSFSGTMETTIRLNQIQAIHAQDSVRLATDFAQAYNRHMYSLLRTEFGYKCDVPID